jgi:hypothetical protein
MTFTFRPATREQVGLLIGVAGPSGSGKTFSAMRLATGITPAGRRFAVIDTEAGRAKHYADIFKFDHGDLQPPFRPSTYADAIKAADEAGYPVIVVDSCSHEHAGEGGLLDWQEEELNRMAGNDWQKREACKMAAWVKPKMAHKQMVQRLLQVRAHLILCFRAEQKVEMVRGQSGRMEIQPKKIAAGFSDWIPICEKNLLYELTTSFLLTPDRPGVPLPIKLQEQHRDFFPAGQTINEKAGELLAAWAQGGSKPVPKSPKPAPAAPTQPVEAPAAAPSDEGPEHPLFSAQADKVAAIELARSGLAKPIPEDLWVILCREVCGVAPADVEKADVAVLDDFLGLLRGIKDKNPAAIKRANALALKREKK